MGIDRGYPAGRRNRKQPLEPMTDKERAVWTKWHSNEATEASALSDLQRLGQEYDNEAEPVDAAKGAPRCSICRGDMTIIPCTCEDRP